CREASANKVYYDNYFVKFLRRCGNRLLFVIFWAMDEKFLKPYDPSATESRLYEAWEKSGYFNPDNLPGERTESFTVTLPPPNVTGVLHLGHAYEDSLQDAVIRFQRMRG